MSKKHPSTHRLVEFFVYKRQRAESAESWILVFEYATRGR